VVHVEERDYKSVFHILDRRRPRTNGDFDVMRMERLCQGLDDIHGLFAAALWPKDAYRIRDFDGVRSLPAYDDLSLTR
jgi:hypothetical protein